jgi:hypothetical protein
MEQWKEVVDYPMYEISTQGNIRKNDGKGNLYKVSMCPSPVYLMFNVWQHKKATKLYAHREMLRAFRPTDDPKLTHVCFKDGDIYNLKLENLYWSTQTKRMRRRYNEGGYAKGEDHHFSKLTESEVIQMREMWETEEYTQKFIANQFGIHISTLNNIIKKRYWSHI